MGLRDQLEAAKQGKQVEAEQSEALEQAQIEQERQGKEADFQQSFAKRNTLKKALEDLRQAKGNLGQAWGKRKGELRNIVGLMDEIKAENPDATIPTIKEAVAEPEEGSDEEKYVDAKTGVEGAISDVRIKKKALGGLGVEADGLSDQELEQAVQGAFKESDREAREYVRAHQDSELPEAQEVQGEMVREAVESLLKSRTLNNSYTGEAANKAFADQFSISVEEKQRMLFIRGDEAEPRSLEEVKQNIDERIKKSVRDFLKQRLPNGTHQNDTILRGYSAELNRLGVENDSIGREAVATLIRMQMTGGNIIDPESNHRIEGYQSKFPKSGTALLLGYDSFDQIPTDLVYEDKSGFTPKGKATLAEALSLSAVEEIAGKILERSILERELGALPAEKATAEEKKRELDRRLRDLPGEIQRAEDKVRSMRTESSTRAERQRALEQLPAKLKLLLSGEDYGSMNLSKDDWSSKFVVSLESFNIKSTALWEERKNRIGVLRENAETAKRTYEVARDAKRGWFDKKELQQVQDEAYRVYMEALRLVDEKNLKEDPEYNRLSQAIGRLDGERKQAEKEIIDLFGNEIGLFTTIKGEDAAEFLREVEEKVKAEVAKMIQYEEEASTAITDQEEEANRLRQERTAASDEADKLNWALKENGDYQSFSGRAKALRGSIESLERDIVGRF